MSPSQEPLPPVVPIFPLPELVLFPRVVVPLHIFEPRYRAMMVDALAGPPLIASVLLKPGFEPLYETEHAPIHPIAGIGRIVVSEQLDDGTYNILLRGEVRARLVEEVPGRPYRRARIAALAPPEKPDTKALRALRDELRKTIGGYTAAELDIREHWMSLFESALAVGDIADVIASSLRVDAELRQCLLEEPAPIARVELLLSMLRDQQAVTRQRRVFRPGGDFSLN